ncbi:centromeric protein-C [Musca autumnalis]|uniref:centromeric protein-C n=1 Tax=Musca autumnalis TaxID=221902 RepID=UPI003CFB1300
MAVPSRRKSDSLDLSEYFNNDDSEGYRLAEFLQKRRGCVQRQNFLFVNNEPFRLSVDVQTEKAEDETNRKEEETKAADQNKLQTSQEKTKEAAADGETGGNEQNSTLKGPGLNNMRASPEAPICNKSPLFKQTSPMRPSPVMSPRISAAIRKSGGYSPSDHLRRYSLKRLSKFGRRTLLQEFESTVSDSAFAPDVCSTPLSQEPVQNKTASRNDENIVPNTEQDTNSTFMGGSGTDKIFTTMQCKDTELRQMLGNIIESTLKKTESGVKRGKEDSNVAEKTLTSSQNSPVHSKRVYTLEKGEKPGQVILTPEKNSQIQPLSHDESSISRHASLYKSRNKRSASQVPNRSMLLNTSSVPQRNACSSPNVTLPDVRLSGSLMEISPCISHHQAVDRNPVVHDYAAPKDNKSAMNITLLTPRARRSFKKSLAMTEEASTNQSHITIRVESPRFGQSQNVNQCRGNNEGSAVQQCIHSPSTAVISDKCHVSFTSTPSKCQGPSNADLTHEEVPNTQQVNISFANATNCEDMMVPETQEAVTELQNCITVQTGSNLVVVPVNQTFNNTLRPSSVNLTTDKIEHGEKLDKEGEQGMQAKETTTNFEPQFDGTDNIKLTDIMTDDEEPTAKTILTESIENDSQVPLNLAACNSNGRSKRLRKKSLPRRRLRMENSQIASTETETEVAPLPLHNQVSHRKRISKKKQIPLNKAPGTPLNGERFALELARMSNYEILDLRKRNSMGRVFPINGRKSSRAKEEAIKKQLQLCDEIEMELKRRNGEMSRKDDDHYESLKVGSNANMEQSRHGNGDNECLPAPDEFRDTISQGNMDDCRSSLIDERSKDLVSFITKTKKQERKQAVPEVLQHYLEIPNRLSQKKKSMSLSRSRPRTLYTHGLSDSEDKTLDSSAERNHVDNNEINKQCSLAIIPSPPKSDLDCIPSFRVVSPPPPEEQCEYSQISNAPTFAPNLPPPPQFESDSGIERNSPTLHSPNGPTDENKNDESVFKKPLAQPPRKARGAKKKDRSMLSAVNSDDLTPANGSSGSTDSSNEQCSDSISNCNLRRSKRGHVPLKTPQPLFQLLFQKVLDNREKLRERRKLHESAKASATNRFLSSDTKAVKKKKRTQDLCVVSENDQIPADNIETTKKARKEKGSNTKSTIEEKKKHTPLSGRSLECSRIKLTNPPPIDHFNNIFDNLRNTSTDIISPDSAKQMLEKPTKEKKLRVRVARMKAPMVPSSTMTTPPAKNVEVEHNSICNNDHVSSGQSVSVTSSGDTNNSNLALISWLKNITETETVSRNDDIFKEMRISSASSLGFTELQGVEYAFYDTEDKASLGYLRFKPRQIKPRKRAKKYHLHFVTLDGNFRITANDKERIVGPGDMVAIEKSVYYEIENLSNDTGILMVIKK